MALLRKSIICIRFRGHMQRARAKIANQLFGTSDAENPTPTLKRFWKKTGLSKNKSLNEVVAILLNAPKIGWTQEYNKQLYLWAPLCLWVNLLRTYAVWSLNPVAE